MLQKTKGIVLSTMKYSESSVICRILTEEFGKKSYLINGVRKQKKARSALFQPLTILDLVVYNKENTDLNRISEYKCELQYKTLPFSYKKAAVATFCCEIVNKTTIEGHPIPESYAFFKNALTELDDMDSFSPYWHLSFLLKYAVILGFCPENEKDLLEYLDQMSFVHYETEMQLSISALIKSEYDQIKYQNIAPMLESILKIYRHEMSGLHDLKTLSVLRDLN